MKAIVLAAGHGKRLIPITSNRPKHVLQVGNNSILKRILDDLLNDGCIEEIFVVVHYYAELIEEMIKVWYSHEHELFSRIKIVFQQEALGTGDATKCALQKFEPVDKFLVVYGDLILGQSISKIIQLSQMNTSFDGFILGVPVKHPEKFGVLKIKNGALQLINEKPKTAPMGSLINGGLYIFPKIAKKYISQIGKSKRNEKELTDVIFDLVNSGNKINVMKMEKGWFDIGHPWQLLDANEYVLEMEKDTFQILGNIEQGVTIKGCVHLAKTAKLRSGVYIEGPVFIDEGADIGPNSYIRRYTYVGRDVRIGHACEIKNSIIYKGTHTAHLSYVGDSIIGENCNLGAGTITANLRHDGKNVKVTIKGKRKISSRRKLGVIMGDYVKTGIGVSILPGVIISSRIWINADETVSKDV